jgi:hypothetical protein
VKACCAKNVAPNPGSRSFRSSLVDHEARREDEKKVLQTIESLQEAIIDFLEVKEEIRIRLSN